MAAAPHRLLGIAPRGGMVPPAHR